MSGFSNDTKGQGKFANFREGKIITKINGEKKEFTTLTGFIKAVYIDDANYDNKDYRKVNVLIEHDSGETILGFPLSSGYGNAFCRLLPNVDISKEVSISGSVTPDKNDPKRKYSSLFVSHGKTVLEWYYSKKNENDKKVPAIKEQTVGSGRNKKIVKDYSQREDFFERLIMAFDKKLQKMYGKKDKPKTADDVTEPIDDLPF